MQADFHRRYALLAIFAVFAGACSRAPTEPAPGRTDAAIALANEHLANSRTAEALAALNALRTADPENAAVLEALAFALVQDDKGAQAAPFFEQAAVRDANRRALLAYAAGIHAQENRHADAARIYRAYLRYFPQDTAAWRNAAREHAALGETQPALEAYGQVLALAPDTPFAATDSATIAQLYSQLGDAERAASWWRNTLDASPDPATAARARLALLALAQQQKDWDGIERLLAQFETDAEARAALAASPMAGLPAQARERRAALAVIAAERSRALAEARAKQLRDGAGLLHQLSLRATNAKAFSLVEAFTLRSDRGVEYIPDPVATPVNFRSPLLDGDLTEIVTLGAEPGIWFERLREQARGAVRKPSTPAIKHLGAPPVIFAVVFVSGALPVSPPPPKNTAYLHHLAAAQAAQAAGDYPAAINAYWKALGENDSSASVWLALGRACLAAGQADDAANVAQEAARRAPDDPAPTVFLLEVLKAGPSPARYRAELLDAFETFPGSADIAFAAAELYKTQNNPRAQAAVLREFLNRAPAADPRRAEAETALAALPQS